jgi:xylulokinase
MQDLVIGIDCGTTALKGVLCDAQGRVLALAQRDIALLTPAPGHAEQDPDAVWQALCEVVRTLSAQCNGRMAALCIGAQAGSIIPAGANACPVHPMITFLDGRAIGIVDAWTKNGNRDVIREITGWGLQVGQPLMSMVWLREHCPDVFAHAAKFIGPHDDLVHRLTGKLVSNASCGAQMPLIERETGQWSERIATMAGIRTSQLPALQPPGSVIGELLPEVADQLNLPRNALVINGGQDHCCEALALGMVAPGKLMLATGTAWVITGIADSADMMHLPAQMDLNAHVVPQRWTMSTYMGGFGAIVEWWLRSVPVVVQDRYTLLEQALNETPAGSNHLLFLPESVRRTTSQFIGLTLKHTWHDMTRAIIEGAAYEVRRNVDALRAADFPMHELHMLGGAAKNAAWVQLMADVLNVPIRGCDDSYLGAKGAAMLAGAGASLFELNSESFNRFSALMNASQPNPTTHAVYNEHYAAWLNAAHPT